MEAKRSRAKWLKQTMSFIKSNSSCLDNLSGVISDRWNKNVGGWRRKRKAWHGTRHSYTPHMPFDDNTGVLAFRIVFLEVALQLKIYFELKYPSFKGGEQFDRLEDKKWTANTEKPIGYRRVRAGYRIKTTAAFYTKPYLSIIIIMMPLMGCFFISFCTS